VKVIRNNAIDTVTASSESATYPASNLLDQHPKKKWQAADASVDSATLTITAKGKTGGLGMVGIVADHAAISVNDPSGIIWSNVDWSNVEWDQGISKLDTKVEFTSFDGQATLWVEFAEFSGSVTIEVTLYKDAGKPEILSAGVAVVGEYIDFPGLQRPLEEGLHDYSIERLLANGSYFYKQRDIVRTFSGTVILKRDDWFWRAMRDVARRSGKTPMMFQMTDIPGQWTLYGRLQAMPRGRHAYPTHSAIDFQIIEVL